MPLPYFLHILGIRRAVPRYLTLEHAGMALRRSKPSTCLLSGAVRDARVAGTKRVTPLIAVMHSRELPSATFGKPQILWVALMDWPPSSHD